VLGAGCRLTIVSAIVVIALAMPILA